MVIAVLPAIQFTVCKHSFPTSAVLKITIEQQTTIAHEDEVPTFINTLLNLHIVYRKLQLLYNLRNSAYVCVASIHTCTLLTHHR